MLNVQGAKAALVAFSHATTGEVVTASHLLERQKVCAKCPYAVGVSGFQSNVSRVLGNLANRHRVPKDISRKRCKVCSCSLMLLLPAKAEDLHKDTPQQEKNRPDYCWVKKELDGKGL